MKQIIFIIFSLSLFFSCGQNTEKSNKKSNEFNRVTGQNVTVISNVDDGHFQYPKYSADGESVYFTDPGYNQIWLYDKKDQSVNNVLKMKGSGFIFDDFGNELVTVKKPKSIRKGSYELISFDLETKETNSLYETENKITNLKKVNSKIVLFFENGEPKFFDLDNSLIKENYTKSYPVYRISGDKLLKYSDNGVKEIVPFEGKNLIWLEYNIGMEKVLFYVAGDALYFINEKEEIKKLGDFRSARLSPDQKFLVYMIDSDDGMKITGSDLYIYSFEKDKSFKITDTKDEVELHPSWSPNGKEIVFATADGKIKTIEIFLD